MEVVGVLGFEPTSTALVSGYARMDGVAAASGIPYLGFKQINTSAVEQQLREWKPDVLFVVGLSQLIRRPLLDLALKGCIGFHPTRLPKGRGRAPTAWIVLDRCPAAASFFLMGEGADDGPLFVQQDFDVDESDDATSVLRKTLDAMVLALDHWLPQLKAGAWAPTPQVEENATWYGVRRPEDGAIDWLESAENICRLIRAATRPHPGAYTFLREHKLTVWKSRVEENLPIKGVVGRILKKEADDSLLVQAGDGLLWLDEYELEGADTGSLRVGQKLTSEVLGQLRALQLRVDALEGSDA